MKQKTFLIILFIIAISLIPRFLYSSDFHFEDPEFYKDEDGHTYPFKFDGYSFIIDARENIGDLWGQHFNIARMIFPFQYPEFMKYIVLLYYCTLMITLSFLFDEFIDDDKSIIFVILAIAFQTNFLDNSFFGFLDRDVFVQFFIVIYYYLFIKRKLILAGIAGILLYFSWNGAFIFIIIPLLLLAIMKIKLRKNLSILTICFSLFIMIIKWDKISIYIFHKSDNYLSLVQEVQSVDFGLLNYLLVFVNIGIIYFLARYFLKNKTFNISLIFTWFIVTNIGIYFSRRHFPYFILPCIITIAIILQGVEFKNKDFVLTYFIMLLVVMGSIQSLKHQYTPYMNDAIYEAMTDIRGKDYDLIIGFWSNGVFYETYSGIDTLYRSVPPEEVVLGEALLNDNISLAYNIYKSLCGPNNCVAVFYNFDLEVNETLSEYYNLPFSSESLMQLALDPPIPFFKLVSCKEKYYKRICIYEV